MNTTLTRINKEQLKALKIKAAKEGKTILELLTRAVDKILKPRNKNFIK